ncbi:MAG: hypothetical protein MUQ26_00460, partial [Armatimonadetes bacterium]|nr:hypothetical protein [Armatimonadota bacterium]
LMAGERQKASLLGNGLILREFSTPPAKALMSALTFADSEFPGCVPEAKEIVAYYGLLTDELDIERKWVDRPAWFIYLGGISRQLRFGGPIGSPPPPPATEALLVLDATTGECHKGVLFGKPRQRTLPAAVRSTRGIWRADARPRRRGRPAARPGGRVWRHSPWAASHMRAMAMRGLWPR